MIETHAHLTHSLFMGEAVNCLDKDFSIRKLTLKELLTELKDEFEYVVEPAIDFESNWIIRKFAEENPGFVYTATGLHPTRTDDVKCSFIRKAKLCKLAKTKTNIAIGETGLDYHKNPTKKQIAQQKKWFIYCIKLANKLKLPLILHIREANEDAIKILRKYKPKYGAIVHCFNKGREFADVYTQEFGFLLGIGGSLFQGNEALSEVVKNTASIVLETDSPFVLPGRRPVDDTITSNQWKKTRVTPLFIPAVAEEIAHLQEKSPEDIIDLSDANANKLFFGSREK